MTIFTFAGTLHWGTLYCPCMPRYGDSHGHPALFHHMYAKGAIEP